MKNKNIVIIGGGQTAVYAAKTIRSIDLEANITIISEEKNLAYEKPPLSKDFLLDKISFEKCLFFAENYYLENNIKFIKNEKIINVNFNLKQITSYTGNLYKYDKLLIATGSSSRQLKFDLEDKEIENNIVYLRNIHDSVNIKDKLSLSKKILIIGGGFIGLEIASAANQLGKEVVVVEMVNNLMGRVIPEQIAKIIQKTHEDKGTQFFLGKKIKKIVKNGKSFEAILDSDERILTDLIVVGVGSQPNIDLFKNTELKIENGILTNEFCQTSITDVFAAGDIANFFHPFYEIYMRLESFKHAQNHGINAGYNIVNNKTAYSEIPWMWSDQFNLNLQMTGICNNFDSFAKRGDDVNEGVIYFFLKSRKIVGACGVGIGGKIGRDIRLAGKLSEKKVKLTKEILGDKNKKLNKILNNI